MAVRTLLVTMRKRTIFETLHEIHDFSELGTDIIGRVSIEKRAIPDCKIPT